jgi:hypothetical protein
MFRGSIIKNDIKLRMSNKSKRAILSSVITMNILFIVDFFFQELGVLNFDFKGWGSTNLEVFAQIHLTKVAYSREKIWLVWSSFLNEDNTLSCTTGEKLKDKP